MLSRKSMILEGIEKCKTATAKAVDVRDSTTDPEVKKLAEAIHWLSFGVQEMGLGLSDEGRVSDLPQ